MQTFAKYIVAAGSLAGALWMIRSHEYPYVAGSMILFAGILVDPAEVLNAITSLVTQGVALVRAWRGGT